MELLAKLRQRYDEAIAFGITHNRHRDWHDGNHPGYTLGCWLRDNAGPGLARSRDANLSGLRVAQSGVGADLALHPVDPDGPQHHGRTYVSAHARRARPRDERISEIVLVRPCHAPRRRGIQYSAAVVELISALEYWISRLRGG